MEEDDEIDVLGEFNLESLLTKNDNQIYEGDNQLGLHCESQWMLDTTAQASWYDNKSDPQQQLGACSALEAYETNIWTDKERYLLEKGLELFGRSWSRLAQYIGTKSANQVKAHVGIGWAGKSSGSTSSCGIDNMDFNFSELIDGMDIPASMEEVIAVVSTAQPTVVLPTSQRDNPNATNSSPTRKGKTRLKKDTASPTKRRLVSVKSKENNYIYNAEDIKEVLTGNKERDHIILPNGEQVIRIRHGPSLSDDSDVDVDVDSDVETYKDELPIKEKDSHEKESSEISKEIIQTEESVHYKDKAAPKEENEKCIVNNVEKEVSVLSRKVDEDQENIDKKETHIFKGSLVTPSGKMMTVVVEDMVCNSVCGTDGQSTAVVVSKYPSTAQERLDAIYQLPPPTQENVIDYSIVSKEEKFLNPEFFSRCDYQGRPRYLKIRNRIIDFWKATKPKYVNKTAIRAVLKNCGDVNLISRIHAYLEQRGYINFGCEQCHYNNKTITQSTCNGLLTKCNSEKKDGETKSLLVPTEIHDSSKGSKQRLPCVEDSKTGQFESTCKFQENDEKCVKVQSTCKFQENDEKCVKVPSSSTRWRSHKKKLFNEENEGGYTTMHTDSGEEVMVYETPSKKHQTNSNKVRKKINRPVKLIHCKSYNIWNKPFIVEMEVSALALVDVHSHLSPKCEVIGLLGGKFKPKDGGVLSIMMAVPCRTLLSSNIHCDMCPVSQAESSDVISSRGLSVVGWYHSHPQFDPSPSDTDIDTQNTLQSWFNKTGNPFVGLIISPFFSANHISPYRCCHVISEDQGLVPYKLDMLLTNLEDNIGLFKKSIEAAYSTVQKCESFKHKEAFFRCVDSVKHHLRMARVSEEEVFPVIYEIHGFFKKIKGRLSSIT